VNAADRLDDRFGFTLYRVRSDESEAFLASAREAADVFGRHALSWSLWRNREDPERWVEFGPRFRERAALERAAEELEETGILETLAAFEEHEEPDGEGIVSSFVQVSPRDHDVMFEVGERGSGPFPRKLPPIDPARMTAAMRLAHALAGALATRLAAVVPPPYRVVADQERVYLLDDDQMVSGGNIVDLDIEDAVTRVLTDVQDDLTEELTTPWPHDPARGYVFHEPGVAIRAGAVRFWYGEEDAPVLSFDPIPVADLEA
jgi:hypothetical protein